MRNTSRMSAMALAASTLIVSGCGVTGKWESTQLSPEIARDEYRLVEPWLAPGHEFTRAHITIRHDGSYDADVHYGDIVRTSTGKWEEEDGTLTFVDDQGCSATYKRELSGDHKKLTLIRPIKGTDVKLTLARAGS